MQAIPAFVISLAATTGLAAGVSLVLLRPLASLLGELCGTAVRARFWSAFAVSATILMVLFTSLVAAPRPSERVEVSLATFDVVVSTARAGVLGLLLSVGALGCVLLVSIGRYEAQHRAERFRSQGA